MSILLQQLKRAHSDKRGFVVLFTVLISVIILVMALGIFNIALKETELTISAKESNFAFYAADAGSECALYYDLKEGAFLPLSTIVPQCRNGEVDSYDAITPTLFTFEFDVSERGCAKVEVNKNFVIGGTSYTRIISQGYNIDCPRLDTYDTNRIVERLLEVTYPNGGTIIAEPDGGDTGGDTGVGADATASTPV